MARLVNSFNKLHQLESRWWSDLELWKKKKHIVLSAYVTASWQPFRFCHLAQLAEKQINSTTSINDPNIHNDSPCYGAPSSHPLPYQQQYNKECYWRPRGVTLRKLGWFGHTHTLCCCGRAEWRPETKPDPTFLILQESPQLTTNTNSLSHTRVKEKWYGKNTGQLLIFSSGPCGPSLHDVVKQVT